MEGGWVSYDTVLVVWSLVAGGVLVALCFVPAPYGRHARRGWGPTVDSRWGWVWMELAAVLTMPAIFLLSGRRDPLSWIWVALWEVHYLHRTFVFPFRRPVTSRRMPWSVVAMGAGFNLVNGYLIGWGLFVVAPPRSLDWLGRPATLVGLMLFVAGLVLNLDSDYRLLRLRRRGEYSVPRGGGFRWVSCPNYLGEIVEWSGWALATWSLGGVVFAWWTIANLAPRAWANHRWYRRRFGEYPDRRKALVPFLW